MPRTIIQNKVIKDKRREEILSASLKLFVLNGFDSVSMDDIAKQIKCSHGLIYHYYSNKKEILVELVKKAHAIIAQDLNSIFKEDVPYYDKFIASQKYFFNLIKSNEQKRYVLFLYLTLPLNKSLTNGLKTPALKTAKDLENLVSQCQKEGHFQNIKSKDFVVLYLNYYIGMLYSVIKKPDITKYLNYENFINILTR